MTCIDLFHDIDVPLGAPAGSSQAATGHREREHNHATQRRTNKIKLMKGGTEDMQWTNTMSKTKGGTENKEHAKPEVDRTMALHWEDCTAKACM